ncbi:MAG: hypothetical protein K2M89_06225 [Clostridiales bacterium]|nr:hypothetical protein [Clostridiales bacterium]
MADVFGTIECTIESCMTDRDGSLVMALRAKSGEKRSAEQILDETLSVQKTPNKRLIAQFKWHREKRSLNANAYFHVLVGKIAKATQQSETEIKRHLVFDYGVQLGALVLESDMAPEKAGVDYAKPIKDFQSPKGKPCVEYMVYKQTRKLDTAEMARLIDGTVSEAQQLGIETKTPAELDKIKALWASDKE